jgi:hypothetical protein
MKYANSIIHSVLFLLLIFLSINCNDAELTTPFDPASKGFISRPEGLLIDDFDTPSEFNLLRCQRETCMEHSALIKTSFNNESLNVLRGVGHSFAIDFNVSNDSAYCSFSDLLTTNNHLDSTRGQFNLWVLGLDSLTDLQFWVKSESKNIDFEIALKDNFDKWTDPRVKFSECEIIDTRMNWKKVRISVTDLWHSPNNYIDKKSVREINFSFSNIQLKKSNKDLKGIIYLDEISFERRRNIEK